jgi:hypothetical protein
MFQLNKILPELIGKYFYLRRERYYTPAMKTEIRMK